MPLTGIEIVTTATAVASAVATGFAAYTAWRSHQTAKRSFTFQQQLAKNQHLSLQLHSVLKDLAYLKKVAHSCVEGLSDEEFKQLEPFHDNVRRQLEQLSYQTEYPYRELGILSSECVWTITTKNPQLDEAISAVQNHLKSLWE